MGRPPTHRQAQQATLSRPDQRKRPDSRHPRDILARHSRDPRAWSRGAGEQGSSLSTVPAETAPAKAVAEPESFSDFWDAYGKKTGRPKSLTAFKAALKKPGVTSEVLIEAASEYVEWAKVEGKFPDFTKDPATWLRGEHWNDERSARERAKPRTKLDGFADVDAELAADEEGYSEVRRIGGAR